MAVVTFSTSFGSGGSVVADRVAANLGWELHNRAIPVEVASRLSLPLEAALINDEASESRIGRLLTRFSVQLASDAGNIPSEVFVGEEAFMRHSEAIIRELASRSNCVIVGRAASIVLRDVADALHVRLDGEKNRRATQAAKALDISIDESRKRLIETDRARSLYVRHFYGCDWADATLYHIVLDSTVLSLDVCVEMILSAALQRFGPALKAKLDRS